MNELNLQHENEILRQKLAEAEELIEAIRTGAVDAIAVHGDEGPQIFTLSSADHTYRLLVEKMGEGALTLNKDGVILYCNSQFATLVNQPLISVLGSSFKEYLSEENQGKYQQLFECGWKENCKGDFVIYPANKEPIYVKLSLNTIETTEGMVLSIVVTDDTAIKKAYIELEKTQEELKLLNKNLENIVVERTNDVNSARKELQDSNLELLRRNEQLNKTNVDLDNFIYTASHDLKAPISNIEGLVEILKQSLLNNSKIEIETILDMIRKSVNRFKLTIQDLTHITKVQKGAQGKVEVLDLYQIIEDVTVNIADLIENSGAKLNLDIENCRYIKFSRKNLYSILYNLISNAIKYRKTDVQPIISFKTNKVDDIIIITVKDNGLGISKKNQEKIFTMFKRFHDHVEGTGIGLYIVKRIIENAGGRIEIESEVNKGTNFIISIPESK